MTEPSHHAKNAAAFREGLATVFAEILTVLEQQENELETQAALFAGESFTITGPPMVWDSGAGTFIVDEDRAADLGWICETRSGYRWPGKSTVVWKKTMLP